MKRQMTSSVLWNQTMQAMYAMGARHFVEVGPKGVLNKMVKPNLADSGDDWTSTAIGTLEAAEAY